MSDKTQMLAVYEVNGIERTVTPNDVLAYMVDPKEVKAPDGRCLIPPREMMRVIMTCQARKLDPFTGDVVVQPRRNKDGSVSCTLVVTKDFYQRRAAQNPAYMGKESGIVILTKDGRPIRREGCSIYKALGETLLGGWCRVHVAGHEVPEYAEVSFEEYNQGYALWKTKPATMIQKVAISQALRAAFPNEFNGTYEPEEIGFEKAPEPIPAPVVDVHEVANSDGEYFDEDEVF